MSPPRSRYLFIAPLPVSTHSVLCPRTAAMRASQRPYCFVSRAPAGRHLDDPARHLAREVTQQKKPHHKCHSPSSVQSNSNALGSGAYDRGLVDHRPTYCLASCFLRRPAAAPVPRPTGRECQSPSLGPLCKVGM